MFISTAWSYTQKIIFQSTSGDKSRNWISSLEEQNLVQSLIGMFYKVTQCTFVNGFLGIWNSGIILHLNSQ